MTKILAVTDESRFDKYDHLATVQREAIVLAGRTNCYSDEVIELVLGAIKPDEVDALLAAAGVDDFTVFNVAARALGSESNSQRRVR